ncbi:chemotaxis protein CheA [Thiospirochaeta perfilievii]|uniref:Chemotaxis protein CheA n=1 Tax=Thiospirochaeta perfilievii TaxID=252967 RepID=A0A5C1QDE6_9SPIO|nr:chemotaxis protein CheA [Thiospirochaeta perfilievii]QEN06105.1 chemotaxis protein CheA [Thiospirochaeta perfilievii]
MSDYLDPNNEELLKDFFIEAQMQVEQLEQNILSIENNPNDKDSIDEIFRAAHTLKGGAATVQMAELASFTHIVEDLLDDIRAGQISITGNVVDSLLSSLDIIKLMLEARSEGDIYNEDITSIENTLHSFKNGTTVSEPAISSNSSKPTVKVKNSNDLSEYDLLELKNAAGNSDLYVVEVTFDPDNPMNSVGGIQIFTSLKSLGEVLKTSPDFDVLYDDNFNEKVKYYLASNEDIELIKKKSELTDVTLSSSVIALSNSDISSSTSQVDVEDVRKIDEVVEKVKYEDPVEVKEPDSEASFSEKEEVEDDGNSSSQISKKGKKNVNSQGSILRVDSRRIDEILNLVSEAVITKATFNQISNQFADSLMSFQNSETQYKDQLKRFFDALPELIDRFNREGTTSKEIKKYITDEFSSLNSVFDDFETNLKSTVNLFRSTATNLGRTTGDLHESVLRVRMVPIGQVFSRFPRLVRDLSKKLDKNINLIIEGEDTELDKSVIEDLLDPLMHCVRNSIDHGIESKQDRAAKGKSEDGHILLKAKNEGNMIVIEIADDGAGIDVKNIMAKAVKNGIIHENKNLTDLEAFNLIFEPGFSTAKSVTDISGRGVGLDVVRRKIEKLNGSVSVWSELGSGTRFTIKLPLTLAIIQGLLVRVGKEIFAIPITSVAESHRIKPNEIRFIDNYEVFNVREDVISLLRLNRLFRLPDDNSSEYKFVVIVGSGEKRMGLMVDSLIGEEDVVIKPLNDHYTSSPGIAGATILGDGTVSLIIDVSQLLELGMKNEVAERKQRDALILG